MVQIAGQPGTDKRARRRRSTVPMRSMRGTAQLPIMGWTITSPSLAGTCQPPVTPGCLTFDTVVTVVSHHVGGVTGGSGLLTEAVQPA